MFSRARVLHRPVSIAPRARLGAFAVPMTSFVDRDVVKAALALSCVDPSLSVLVRGGRGSGKSTLCRSVASVVPNKRFVTVPLGVTDERVLGSVDVEASAKTGRAAYEPGLLAEANDGVLFIDDVNLVDEHTLTMMLSSLDAGVVRVEREGLSAERPCRALRLASFTPEEGDVRARVLDRFAMICSTDDAQMDDVQTRIEAVDAAMAWQDDWRAVTAASEDAESALRNRVATARDVFLPNVRVSEEIARRLVQSCVEYGVLGHRGDVYAAKVARASCALRHAVEVNETDVAVAVALVVEPRATRATSEDDVSPPPPQPQPSNRRSERAPRETDDDEETEEQEEEQETPQTGLEMEPTVKDADESRLDVDALLAAFEDATRRSFAEKSTRGTMTGRTKRQSVFDLARGRYVKAIFPKGGHIRGKIAVDATLRAAAPHQLFRRRRHSDGTARRVFITKDDVRLKKLSRRAASLTIFLVDASGSMAINRITVAKVAALKILHLSYTKRDTVALVEMSADAAVVVLPPTRSTLAAARRLAALPCGGGTPLAHGLRASARVAANAHRARGKSTVGAVREIILTDARPTVSLRWSENPNARVSEPPPSRRALREETLVVAAERPRLVPFLKTLVVDTDSPFVSDHFARDVALAMRASYLALPQLDDVALESALLD